MEQTLIEICTRKECQDKTFYDSNLKQLCDAKTRMRRAGTWTLDGYIDLVEACVAQGDCLRLFRDAFHSPREADQRLRKIPKDDRSLVLPPLLDKPRIPVVSRDISLDELRRIYHEKPQK